MARVLDRGYRHYEGPRRGAWGPALSVGRNSFQRALGIRRGAATKILPVLSITLAYLPAAAFVGAVALLPGPIRGGVPGYQGYYGFISLAIFLFTAFASPEVLTPDRRSGMLDLYLSSPLTPLTYVAAKAGSLLAILSVVTLGPPLLLTVAFTMQGVGPKGPGDLALTLGRIVLAGLTLAGIFGAVALAVSSLTDRRAFASAGVVFVILVPNVVTGVLVNGFRLPRWLTLVSLNGIPFELVQRIYGRPGTRPSVASIAVVGMWAAVVAISAGVLWFRYRRSEP